MESVEIQTQSGPQPNASTDVTSEMTSDPSAQEPASQDTPAQTSDSASSHGNDPVAIITISRTNHSLSIAMETARQ